MFKEFGEAIHVFHLVITSFLKLDKHISYTNNKTQRMTDQIESIVECLEYYGMMDILHNCIDIKSILQFARSVDIHYGVELYVYLLENDLLKESSDVKYFLNYEEIVQYSLSVAITIAGEDPDEICFESLKSKDNLINSILVKGDSSKVIQYVIKRLAVKFNYPFSPDDINKILSLFNSGRMIKLVSSCGLDIGEKIICRLINPYSIKNIKPKTRLMLLRNILQTNYYNKRIIRRLLKEDCESIFDRLLSNSNDILWINIKAFKLIVDIVDPATENLYGTLYLLDFGLSYHVCNHVLSSPPYEGMNLPEVAEKFLPNCVQLFARRNKFNMINKKHEVIYNLSVKISSS